MNRRLRLCLIAGVLAACGPAPESTGGGDSFVAFGDSFDGFRSWKAYHLDSPVEGGSIHSSGPRTEYLNAVPDAGSTEFPVGTVIVKVFDTDATHTFAMAKRGGGYNPDGAKNWEWFEIQDTADGAEKILWRGVGPPVGETYGNDTTTCNACHVGAVSNDYVPSPALQLKGL